MEPGGQRYRILSFVTSNEEDEQKWFALEIQVHSGRFRISVKLSNFDNSPARSEEFEGYHALLCAEHNDSECSFDEAEEEVGPEDAMGRDTLSDCFDWAVLPCLAEFERVSPAFTSPQATGRLTLSHFLANTAFECELVAADEVLAPGVIEPVESDEDCWPSPSSEDAWTTSFPSFTPAVVEVICEDPQRPFESNPTRVRIGQQHLYFKEVSEPGDLVEQREVETYEKIAAANFGPDVRTSRLYGVVRNDKNQLAGLLLHLIDEDMPLTFAVGLETSPATKERWAKQIRDTLNALHLAGITWGDAKPDNVLVDVHGDAWIVDFGGGRTQGWVDRDKAGTVAGDLQALQKILQFIETGEEFYEDDSDG